MHRTIRALAVAGVILLGLVPATTALAHGEAGEGDLSIVIGCGTEPAYAGLPNSVQVILEHDGQPVTDARNLSVDVTFGGATTTYDLQPNFAVGVFGEPGDYRANFVPSEPGAYTFHVTGTVDGEEVDVEMTSGDETFSEVESLQDAAFPPVEAPSAEELAGRIQTESERVDDAVAAAQAAADDASSAGSMATIALALGAIGIIAGIAAIVVARRPQG
jgi:hypothetical protein